MNGDPYYGGEVIPTMGAVERGGIWLATYLARSMGRGLGAAIFTARNGMRVRMNQLWPLIRRYGASAVAGGLGLTLEALGTLALQAPRGGKRKRARGISARDVKTTRRTIGTLKRLVRMSGIRMGGGGGRYRSYAPRRRRGYYHFHR